MIVRMDGKYTTVSGAPVRILCVDAQGNHPVIGVMDGTSRRWSIDGRFNSSRAESSLDLIELTPSPSPLAAAARKVVESYRTDATRDSLHALIAALEAALKDEESK